MKPVTDPSILAQLEGDTASQPSAAPAVVAAPVAAAGKPVTDPNLLAQLEAPEASQPQPLSSAFVDYTQDPEAVAPAAVPQGGMTEGNLFFDGQSGIVPEGTRVIATGARDLGNAGLSLAELIGGLSARVGGVEPGTLPRIPEWNEMGHGMEALEPQTPVGQFLTPLSQYFGGRNIIGKATGEVASKVGERTAMETAKDLGRDAATDFAAFSPEDQRISDSIMEANANPTDGFWNNVAQLAAKTGVPQFLARGENDGSTPEGNATSRAQNVGEGLIIGETARMALKGTKIVGSALLSPFFKGVGKAAEKESQLAADMAAKANKPVEELDIQDVAELARKGYIPAQKVLDHPDVQQKLGDMARAHMDAGTINPNSPEFIGQLDELTKRVSANSQRTSSAPAAVIPAADRDAAIRTLWGEARGEGDDGVAAAANVILNRAEKGKAPLTDVVRAPKQFSAWDDPRTRPGMDALTPEDPEYQRLGNILDEVASGKRADNTGGATHYLNEGTIRGEGRELPKWAKGIPTAKVGNHSFYSPEGAPIKRQAAAAVTVTPEGTAFKGGLDDGARASADAMAASKQADEAAAKATDDEFIATLNKAAETNPIAKTIADTDLPVAAKRAAYEKVAPQIEAEARPAISDQPVLANREGAQVRADVNEPGTAAAIDRERAGRAASLDEMRTAAESNPAVKAVLDSEIDDVAKQRVFENMKAKGQVDAPAAKPLDQGPEGEAPFRGFDESTPRADQDFIVAKAERRTAEEQVSNSNVNAAVQNAKGKPDDRLGKIELGKRAGEAPATGADVRVPESDAPKTEPEGTAPKLEKPVGEDKAGAEGTPAPKRSLRGLREASEAGDEAVDKYMAPDVVPSAAKLTASKHAPTQQIGHGIQDAAPELNALRDDIEAGVADKKMDVSDALETAASAVDNARNEGLTPKAGADLVKGDKVAEQIYRIMHNKNLSRAATREEIADRLGRFVDEAARAGDDADPADILKRIADTPDTPRGQGSMFDQFDNGTPNREAIKTPKSDRDVVDNIEAIGGKLEQKICGI